FSWGDGTDADVRNVGTRLGSPGQLLSDLDSSHVSAEEKCIEDELFFNSSEEEKKGLKPHIQKVMQRRQARGWYSMFYDSYVPLLHTLNQWGRGYSVKQLDEAGQMQALHNQQAYHPVWAFGYDWRQGADLIAQGGRPYAKGEDFSTFLEKVFADSYTDCVDWYWPKQKQVIVVTHSMGSLVARYISEVAGFRDRIAGIIHLAQPTTGAPAASLRLLAGTQTEDMTKLGGSDDQAIRNIMGISPYRYLTAVAQLTGPQTLLASNDYCADAEKAVASAKDPVDWIKWVDPQGEHKAFINQQKIGAMRGTSGLPELHVNGRIGWSAPRFWSRWGSPGAYGYTALKPLHDFKTQWRADAAGVKDHSEPSSQGLDSKFEDVKRAYEQADTIITSLRLKYHPETTAIYSNGGQSITRLTVQLIPVKFPVSQSMDPNTLQMKPTLIDAFQVHWGFERSAGDGTVPESSGKALSAAGVKLQKAIAGPHSEHQNIGHNPQAQSQLFTALRAISKKFI
ncbi:lipase family alpha/beta hydrolase, partial [Roseateles koreensis]|nr:hypothetical protein [Roseateles koreensis]